MTASLQRTSYLLYFDKLHFNALHVTLCTNLHCTAHTNTQHCTALIEEEYDSYTASHLTLQCNAPKFHCTAHNNTLCTAINFTAVLLNINHTSPHSAQCAAFYSAMSQLQCPASTPARSIAVLLMMIPIGLYCF